MASVSMVAICLMHFAPAVRSARAQSSLPDCVVKDEFIYRTAPFPECHAATIVETRAGTLIASWFGGTEERHPDVGIWVSRYEDGGWSKPVQVADGVQSEKLRYPTWNPVLFQPEAGPLRLFFKVGPSPDAWWGESLISKDDGRSWTNRMKLANGGIGPVKNKAVQLAGGSILAPSSDEADGWTVHVEMSRDRGESWTKIGPLNDGKKIRAIQPTILTLNGDQLAMLCRDGRPNGVVWKFTSSNAGLTWSEAKETSLPNPNSGIDAVTLKDGRHLLVYNHTVRSGPPPNGRQRLGVAVSSDAEKWDAVLTLEEQKGEYSYPAVIQTRDGLVHVLYTWNRKRIRHVVMDPAKLQAVPITESKWPSQEVARLPQAAD
ncbi:MAG: sialidase family protein [Pirellulales bacterium]